jgi:hypothetical protein
MEAADAEPVLAEVLQRPIVNDAAREFRLIIVLSAVYVSASSMAA